MKILVMLGMLLGLTITGCTDSHADPELLGPCANVANVSGDGGQVLKCSFGAVTCFVTKYGGPTAITCSSLQDWK